MKIKWRKDYEMDVWDSEDSSTEDTAHQGDVEEVEPFGQDRQLKEIDLQFGNGCCTYGVPLSAFEILEGKEEMEAMADHGSGHGSQNL